jgi:hypothetical protein
MLGDFDGDQIAVGGAGGRARRDGKLAAALLLVDRHESAAAARNPAKNAKRAMLGAIDEFYDAPADFLVAVFVEADQRSVADAGDFAGFGTPWRRDMDDRRCAMGGFIPFGRPRQ